MAGNEKTDRELAKLTEEKVVAAKNFLHKFDLKLNVYYLLGLVGATFIGDFEEIDDGLLASIEEHVRAPSFVGEVGSESEMPKTERIKFLGGNGDVKLAKNFAFTDFDKRKLLRVAQAAIKHREEREARERLEQEKERAEKSAVSRKSDASRAEGTGRKRKSCLNLR